MRPHGNTGWRSARPITCARRPVGKMKNAQIACRARAHHGMEIYYYSHITCAAHITTACDRYVSSSVFKRGLICPVRASVRIGKNGASCSCAGLWCRGFASISGLHPWVASARSWPPIRYKKLVLSAQTWFVRISLSRASRKVSVSKTGDNGNFPLARHVCRSHPVPALSPPPPAAMHRKVHHNKGRVFTNESHESDWYWA